MAEILPNPWTEAAAYDRITVAGIEFVGKNDLDASTLLKKKSDHRRARGRNGGRTVNAGWDLVEFPLTLTAFPYGSDGLPSPSFAQLEEIFRRVGRGAVATQDQTAVPIAHPYLAASGISQVTVQEIGFVPVQGGGGFGLKLKLKEWRAPAPAPVRAPTAAPQPYAEDGTDQRRHGRGLEQYEARPLVAASAARSLVPKAPRRPSSDP